MVYQRENGLTDSTIEVLLSLVRFMNEAGEYGDVKRIVSKVLGEWINFRPIEKGELIDVEEIAMIESNEKVFPGVSREYWYRRLYGGAILAVLGKTYDRERKKEIVR